MTKYLLKACFLGGVILLSCGKASPEFEGVQLITWKADRNGCSGNRTSMADQLEKQKSKLLGLNEMEIVRVLGQPDRNELSKRNQKFYYYFLEPAPECGNGASDPAARKLIIRFNAVGLAKEIEVKS